MAPGLCGGGAFTGELSVGVEWSFLVARLAGAPDGVLVRRESMVAVVELSSPVNLLAERYRLFRPLVLRVAKVDSSYTHGHCQV